MNKETNPVIAMGIQSRMELVQTIKEAEQRLAMAQETIKQANEAIASLDDFFGKDDAYRKVQDIFSGTAEEFYGRARTFTINLMSELIEHHQSHERSAVMKSNWQDNIRRLEGMEYSEEMFEQTGVWQSLGGLLNNLMSVVTPEGEKSQELRMFATRCMQLATMVPQSFYAGATDFSRGNLNPLNNRNNRMMGGRYNNGVLGNGMAAPGNPMPGGRPTDFDRW